MGAGELVLPEPVELHQQAGTPPLAYGETILNGRFVPDLKFPGNVLNGVYRAEMRDVGGVALKIFGEPDLPAQERTTQELRVHRDLSKHPGIVDVRDMGILDKNGVDYRYLATALNPGGSLKERYRVNPLSNDETIKMAATMAIVLKFVHDRGIIHGDIKPGNILLTNLEDPDYQLTDFGIVKRVTSPVSAIDRAKGDVTKAIKSARPVGANRNLIPIIGTEGFMAPEALKPEGPPTKAIDIYGLGATMFIATTRELPFEPEKTQDDFIEKKETPQVPIPEEPIKRGARISKNLSGIIVECLDPDPNSRPTEEQLHDALLAA